MGGIMCKTCGHQITEAYRFMMFSSEEEMRRERIARPIRWVHIANVHRVKAYPTGVICDAMYFGNECMQLDKRVISDEQRPKGCGCQQPRLSMELETFCWICDKPLYDIMPSQGIDMKDHQEWHKQHPIQGAKGWHEHNKNKG